MTRLLPTLHRLSGHAWQLLASRPHRFVVASFSLSVMLLVLLLWRGLQLSQDREIETLRHMQAVRAQSMDALLQREAERLLGVRNFTEHLLQIQASTPGRPDAALRATLARRDEPVWPVPAHDAAAVYGVGAAALSGLAGFERNEARLAADVVVARSLSHLLSAAPQGSGIRRRIAYVSRNGVLTAYPSIPPQQVAPAVHRLAAAPYFQDSLPARNPGRQVQWRIAPATSERDQVSLFLSVPVYAGSDLRGVAILELPQRSLDDQLSAAPFHDASSYLVDREGRLIGASARNVRAGETIQAALSGPWPAATLEAVFHADAGLLTSVSGGGNDLMFRRLRNGGLAMVDEIPVNQLWLAGAARLSGVIGAGAAALGILLCATLAVVHSLFRHYLARGEALRTLAETDALTGLANRRVFAARFAAEAARCAAEQRPIAVVMLDIDHFKAINDRWGHASGDVVLRAVAAALRSGVRKDDLPARLGGEEFAVLLPGTGVDDAAAVAGNLRQRLERLRCDPAADALCSEPMRFTASFGVAGSAPGVPGSLDALLMAADRRLYAAKANGRNQVVAHEPGNVASHHRNLKGL
ncbi:diguanylate cyclase [Cupriavidus taiwanensis]|uniref:diguanylate cyclase n=1 Tax=Cupriavidus taiwanensis TaxID=164546 RepID=UPI000E182410|nr:diguanylate cyclase [Cupriavidus taiwanensis]SPC18315.1 putative diguanylate cyclase (GGDEF) domain [Cupriavidus taiwanensis]